jgi:hypothetical protein
MLKFIDLAFEPRGLTNKYNGLINSHQPKKFYLTIVLNVKGELSNISALSMCASYMKFEYMWGWYVCALHIRLHIVVYNASTSKSSA